MVARGRCPQGMMDTGSTLGSVGDPAGNTSFKKLGAVNAPGLQLFLRDGRDENTTSSIRASRMCFCEVCSNDASLVCSACKTTRYCSPECQLSDWKAHKKTCKMHQYVNEFNKKLDLDPPERPPAGRCTGCDLKFDGEHRPDDACAKCGYQVCEHCAVDKSNGTCYCPTENFGTPYCNWNPRWWHNNGRGKPYRGPRHPTIDDEYPEEAYETIPRECTNCGKVKRLLKPEYWDNSML
ncbi:hypothetical protein NM688_g6875 [Phlebia brevispora]|uniref:Uncharacterized protein n=1 Tax=Phlebia brevispora TaxID=194682 RepID=A0ACC1SBP7_9APHY|nr:hypothetical protein NM688_g6875 [Phlebia brevispora]